MDNRGYDEKKETESSEREELIAENERLRGEVDQFKLRMNEMECMRLAELKGLQARISELEGLHSKIDDLQRKVQHQPSSPIRSAARESALTSSVVRSTALTSSVLGPVPELEAGQPGTHVQSGHGHGHAPPRVNYANFRTHGAVDQRLHRRSHEQRRMSEGPANAGISARGMSRILSTAGSMFGFAFQSQRFSLENASLTRYLPDSTYSFIMVSKPYKPPFILGLLVFLVQVSTFLSLLYSAMDLNATRNPFRIPVNVTSSVRFTQFIAIIIASATQHSMRVVLNLAIERYDSRIIGRAFPDSSLPKFILAIMTHLTESILGIFVAFVLIITADAEIDLLLNFTAMEFVSYIGQVVYGIALSGFAGRNNYRVAMAIQETSYTIEQRHKLIPRYVVGVFTFILMIVGWTYIIVHQATGQSLCSTVYAQFGDAIDPSLATFSGVYERRFLPNGQFQAKRVYYVEKRSGRAFLAYCEELNSWTFSYNVTGDMEPCNWEARSFRTKTFDVVSTSFDEWYVRNDLGREIALDFIRLQCYDCDEVASPCLGNGQCEDAVCTCNEGFYGPRCEFQEPCDRIQIDRRYGSFEDLGSRRWSTRYDVLRLDNETVDVYNRPVYINEYDEGLFDVIFFTGRRWVATFSSSLRFLFENGQVEVGTNTAQNITQLVTTTSADAMAKYFRDVFHGHWSNYSVMYISAPMDIGSLGNSESPIGFRWYQAELKSDLEQQEIQQVVTARPSDAIFLCSVCDNETNPCLFDGQCVDGTCECSIGSDGALCQIPPVGNGRCDMFYNVPEFLFDGGDCCESTCINGGDFSCGKGESDFVHMGYPYCRLDTLDWVAQSNVIRGKSLSGFSVALSGNGHILAVGEPGEDRVRLFDQNGADWIERESSPGGTAGSRFGSAVALSRGALDIQMNPLTVPPIILLAAQPSGLSRVFHCDIEGCFQIGQSLRVVGDRDDIGGVTVDISSDGQVVALGSRKSSPTSVRVFTMGEDQYWIRHGAFPSLGSVYSLALSGGGDVLAVGWESGDASQTYEQTYLLNETSWIPLGSGFTYTNNLTADMVVHHSQSVALSERGNVFAVGRSSSYEDDARHGVEVYAWENKNWTQRGSAIRSGNSHGGWALALSSDGSVVAIGNGREGGSDRNIRIFNWNGTTWNRLGSSVAGGPQSAVALSASGHTLAVGMPFGRMDLEGRGRTTVYEYPHGLCPEGRSLFHLSVTTDDFPGDTTWEVVDEASGDFLLAGGPYDGYVNSTFASSTCVEQDSCTVFTIYDKRELSFARNQDMPDGTSPPASYTLFVDGNEVGNGTVVDSFARVYVGDCTMCSNDTQAFRMMLQTCVPVSWEFTSDVGEVLFSKNNFDDFEFDNVDYNCTDGKENTYWEDICLPYEDCVTFSVKPMPDFWAESSNSQVLNLQYRLFVDSEEIEQYAGHVGGNTTDTLYPVIIGNC